MINSSLRKKLKLILKNKVILVTGGTGSFGKTIVRELLKYNPKEIRIYSRSEDKQEEMRYQFSEYKNMRFILGDVRDFEQLCRSTVGVDFLFHAAAQKQVPASEYHVLEAIKTNVLGAQNVIDACIKNNVKKALAISTDKAVEPVNAMGMTKALQEKLFIQANVYQNGSKCAFSCVRYGNVLGTTGSVLPLFLKQIKEGKNLTLTNPDMTRFVITLDQAVQLVLTALIKAIGGEIFVPDLPSHTVYDLAQAVLEISKNINLKVSQVGIRVGEKIHETLITPTESLRTIKYDSYHIILPQIRIETIEKKYKFKKRETLFRYASDTTRRLDKKNLVKLLKNNYLSSLKYA